MRSHLTLDWQFNDMLGSHRALACLEVLPGRFLLSLTSGSRTGGRTRTCNQRFWRPWHTPICCTHRQGGLTRVPLTSCNSGSAGGKSLPPGGARIAHHLLYASSGLMFAEDRGIEPHRFYPVTGFQGQLRTVAHIFQIT